MTNDIQSVLFSQEDLEKIVSRLGAQITEDYKGKNLLLVSIPQLNIVGAGISTLICYIVMAAVSLILLRRDCGKGHISNRQTTSIFLSAILCIEGAYLLYSVLSNCLSMRISFVISVLFSVNIYIYSLDILSVLPKSRLKSYFSR